MSTQYHVYASPFSGQPIDYAHPIATVDGLSFQTPGLPPGTWRFGVRAFDTVTGLEESNIDAALTIVIGAGGQDQTGLPSAPAGLLAVAEAGGSIRLHWTYPATANKAKGFHVYSGAGSPSYVSPVSTVLAADNSLNPSYTALLTGLSDGVTYTIGVRSYNASGEESNTLTVSITAKSTGPAAVTSLTAITTV